MPVRNLYRARTYRAKLPHFAIRNRGIDVLGADSQSGSVMLRGSALRVWNGKSRCELITKFEAS